MLTLREIAEQQKAWSSRNFPGNTPLEPLEGIIEEVGELAHSRLKRRQGIRGTAEQHIANERDAIGDIGIYLLDFAWRSGTNVMELTLRIPAETPEHMSDRTFLELASAVGKLAARFNQSPGRPHDYEVDLILRMLDLYACRRGWSFLDILNETWAKVSKRDWVANPMNAATAESP